MVQSEESNIQITSDISYAGAENPTLTLDLYEPVPRGAALRPGIVVIHGGGWFKGDKAQPNFVGMGKFFAGNGFVAVSINYRLADTARAPAALEDCNCAVRWMKAHADQLGVDKEKIVLIGASAGGHLALLAGLCSDPEFDNGEWAEQSSSVAAAIALYPVTDVQEFWLQSPRAAKLVEDWIPVDGSDRQEWARRMSPITYANSDSIPVLLIHGDADTAVVLSQSVKLEKKLKGLSRSVKLLTVPGGTHGKWPEGPVDYDQWIRDEQLEFLRMHGLGTAYPSQKNQADSNGIYSGKEAWERAVGNPKLLKMPAYAYAELDPDLPNVLLIGDSISMGYTAAVRQRLQGKANVCRIPENGGDTARGIEKLPLWLGRIRWDVIHFNWGLHDLKFLKDGLPDLAGELVRTPEEYASNLRSLVESLTKSGAKLIWANTTPVPNNSRGRIADSDLTYNDRASKIMIEHGISIHDLNGYVRSAQFRGIRPENVHFDEEGYSLLGEKVAETIIRDGMDEGL
jgi:acyl-CoA thioesterase-1